MRLLIASVVLAAVALQLVVAQGRPDPRVFRGPFISIRDVVLIRPARQLPLEFEGARVLMTNTAAPVPTLGNVRLQARLQSKTIRPVSAGGITLRVAVGPAGDGILTFRMRAVPRADAPEDSQRIRQEGWSQLVTFAALTGEASPGLQLLQPTSKIVFTLERLDSDDGRAVFENPDATELLWEALGRPSFSLR